ncbi:hypothetical protein KCU93_g7458, partial [Aureobasidium melanogenum]
MPSNTAHIQQRAQLKQHDDLVIAADEQNEWQDGQNELGLPSTPGVRSRPAPTRQCAACGNNSSESVVKGLRTP